MRRRSGGGASGALVYNDFLKEKLEGFRGMISSGFHRGRVRRPATSKTEDVPTTRKVNIPTSHCDSMGSLLSNNIIEKGLAFGRHRSGTVVNSGAPSAFRRSCPARPHGRDGASLVRRDAAINRTEDLNVEVCEATKCCVIGGPCI